MPITPTGVAYQPEQIRGDIVSGADYSAAEPYVAIKQGSTDHSGVVATAGAEVIGIRMNKPAAGEALELICSGSAPVKAGGSITKGDKLKSDGSGEAVAATADGEYYFGVALQDAADGDIFEVDLNRHGFISIAS